MRSLEEATEENNQYAEYLLGKLYLKGEDVDQDLEKAMELLKRSSDQGNKYASYTFAKAMLSGELVPFDILEAFIMEEVEA